MTTAYVWVRSENRTSASLLNIFPTPVKQGCVCKRNRLHHRGNCVHSRIRAMLRQAAHVFTTSVHQKMKVFHLFTKPNLSRTKGLPTQLGCETKLSCRGGGFAPQYVTASSAVKQRFPPDFPPSNYEKADRYAHRCGNVPSHSAHLLGLG